MSFAVPVLLGVFTFAAPWLFAGLALLALPLIAHLLHRRTRQRIVFPTIAFLKQSTVSQSSLFRLRRWILLALRCVAAALIVAAFTRPAWLDAAAETSENATAVVLVIDASASTKQLSAGAPMFDRLRAAAGRTLDALTPGVDSAAVVLATAKPRRSFPTLTSNLDAVRAELESISATDERADFSAALASAGELLARRRDGRVVVLSDLQAENWQDLLEGPQARDLLPPGVRVTVTEPDAAVAENLALSSPRTSPAEPLAGSPVRLIVEAANFSGRRKQARVEARIDDAVIGVQTLDLEPGARLEAGFDTTLDSVAYRHVVFALPPDDFPADDRAYLAINAAGVHPIAVISDDDPKDFETGLFYLVRALAPRGDQSDRFNVRVLKERDVSTPERDPKFATDETIVVCDADTLTEVGAERIRQRVAEGGGLLVFRGDAAADAGLLALDDAPAGTAGAPDKGWLPAAPGPLRRRERREALFIHGGKWRSRFLRSFEESAQAAFGRAPFYRMTEDAPLRASAEALLTFSDESPALVAAPRGRGWVVQATFGPSATSTDLGKFGVFVALSQTLVQELRSPPEKVAGCLPGKPCRISATSPAPGAKDAVAVFGPDGQPASAAVTLAASRLNVELTAPTLLGFYRVAQGDQTLGLGAVNLDPLESNLARTPAKVIAERLTGLGARSAVVSTNSEEQPAVQRSGTALWGWCFGLAGVLLATELALLAYWKR